ncbi:MAG: RsmB/NOP family class I SAM-dependent RNA methyltransferase [Planctomycetota bacterium]
MTDQDRTDARLEAARLVWELHRRGGVARELWPAERTGAGTALVLGTLRRRGTLDAILARHSSRRLPLIKPETLACLRVALFELLFLDDAPAHAVVAAAVDNTKSFERFQDTGFVNALLRGILRRARRVAPAGRGDPRHVLPREGFDWEFVRAVFPDPDRDPVGFLAARGSVPRWMAEARLSGLPPERALRCLELQARTPDTHLRVVGGRTGEVKAALEAAGVPARDGPRPGMLTLPPQVRVGVVLEVCGDRVVVQDAAACATAPFLGPPPGARVLDYCAAPGGKTTHLAELVGPTGSVVACDVDPRRLARVEQNARRLGLRNIRCCLLPQDPGRDFDAALVDVPCSNSAVLGRRPEARWRVRRRDLQGLVDRQRRILRQASTHVATGATLVYATCSLEPEENRGVVEDFVSRAPFELGETQTIYPDEGAGGGGFHARLRRV